MLAAARREGSQVYAQHKEYDASLLYTLHREPEIEVSQCVGINVLWDARKNAVCFVENETSPKSLQNRGYLDSTHTQSEHA